MNLDANDGLDFGVKCGWSLVHMVGESHLQTVGSRWYEL